jgi:hypothetical protein
MTAVIAWHVETAVFAMAEIKALSEISDNLQTESPETAVCTMAQTSPIGESGVWDPWVPFRPWAKPEQLFRLFVCTNMQKFSHFHNFGKRPPAAGPTPHIWV